MSICKEPQHNSDASILPKSFDWFKKGCVTRFFTSGFSFHHKNLPSFPINAHFDNEDNPVAPWGELKIVFKIDQMLGLDDVGPGQSSSPISNYTLIVIFKPTHRMA